MHCQIWLIKPERKNVVCRADVDATLHMRSTNHVYMRLKERYEQPLKSEEEDDNEEEKRTT